MFLIKFHSTCLPPSLTTSPLATKEAVDEMGGIHSIIKGWNTVLQNPPAPSLVDQNVDKMFQKSLCYKISPESIWILESLRDIVYWEQRRVSLAAV